MSKIFRNTIIVVVSLFLIASIGGVKSAHADEADIFLANLKPNVLIILDNSNSMDEDFVGNAISSWATGSRAVEGRRQLLNVVNANANNMRIGLMSFRLPAASKWYLHNGPYFVSYNSRSWCPNPPPECVDYCKNYPGHTASRDTCNTVCRTANGSFDADYSMADANGKDGLTAFAPASEPRNRYCALTYPKTTRVARTIVQSIDAQSIIQATLNSVASVVDAMNQALANVQTQIVDWTLHAPLPDRS